jgi:uracil-DNA glycosylase
MINMQKELGDWYPVLESVIHSPAGRSLGEQLSRNEESLRPSLDKIFRSLTLTQPNNVKVVILGQDPYPGEHADGLAFSSGIDDIPYSLRQIFKSMEINGIPRNPLKISLDDWAEQGVLLLNTALTTLKNTPGAHLKYWTPWTARIIKTIIENAERTGLPLVFICWGSHAKELVSRYILPENVKMIHGYHPSSVRYGYIFRGGEHFLETNKWLIENNSTHIQWQQKKN